jgi:lipoate-protein ligase B
MSAKPILEVQRLGRRPYAEVHALQRALVEERAAGGAPDTLILVEHEPVITLGRGSESGGGADRPAPAEIAGIPVFAVERGGEDTWHGPGQVVAYLIHELPEGRRDLHRYLRDLEEVAIGVLAELGVEGRRREGLTGVWIGARKVCSIGVAVRRWVTWHGLALNVTNDLDGFRAIQPCGLDPALMTRLADHADVPSTFLIEVLVVKHVLAVFGLELPPGAAPGTGLASRERPVEDDPAPGGFPRLPIFPG